MNKSHNFNRVNVYRLQGAHTLGTGSRGSIWVMVATVGLVEVSSDTGNPLFDAPISDYQESVNR